MKRRWFALALVGMFMVAAGLVAADWFVAVPLDEVPKYVGRAKCAECHAGQLKAWTGSHHDLAMDLATSATVLGNFDDVDFEYQGVKSRLFERDGKYIAHTEGPDGKFADFEIKYVIGVDPLQQYMVEFPDGRVQVLRISWDTKRKRWFYHYPPDVLDERLKPDDPLHWTQRGSNWNHMCAECHTTNLKKNFDVKKNEYQTTFSEIDVSCETCHGSGSIHVKLAESTSLFWDRNHGYGLPKLKDPNSKYEIDSCAKCHSRRRMVQPDYRPGGEFLDYYVPQTLRNTLYHADGQILDEVYVLGSFLQTKMHAKGVRCTDCHDPHTARLKHKGNRVCTSCHQHPAPKYDTPKHHHHQAGSAGARCVECHMPEKYYMIVDPRRDHSFRVPRPDLSVALGTPNACTGCHLDAERTAQWEFYADRLTAKSQRNKMAEAEIGLMDQWSLDHVTKWYGPRKDKHPHFAHALAAARNRRLDADEALIMLLRRHDAPEIVRATVMQELGNYSHSAAVRVAIAKGLADPQAMVRIRALANLQSDAAVSDSLADSVAPLLKDRVCAVRNEAVRVLALHYRRLDANQRRDFDAAAEVYLTSLRADGDQAPARDDMATLYANLGKWRQAEREVLRAIALDKHFTAAKLHLAVIYQRQDELEDAEKVLRELIKEYPDWDEAHYRIGLVLAVDRRFKDAEQEFEAALRLRPRSAKYLHALTAFYLDLGAIPRAAQYCQMWMELHPNDPDHVALWRKIFAELSRRRRNPNLPRPGQ